MAYTNHSLTVPVGTGIATTTRVTPGRQMQVGVQDGGGGATVNVIAYLYTEDEKATRLKHILAEAVTLPYSSTSLAGFVELGIEVTGAGTNDVEMEILQCKT